MPGVERNAKVKASEGTASETGSLNLRWAERFISALVEAGVREAVVSPGSRSAPLALAIDRAPMRAHIALDERAGAYFALGLAKASRRPVAVLCTSGTAAANFFPAVLEAFHARVPLIALTADRPPELRDTGAPQTIDQLKLFGDRVRWFSEVGTPAPDPQLLAYVASLGARAAAAAWGPPAGPVHLNFAFREPLVAGSDSRRGSDASRQTSDSSRGLEATIHEGPDVPLPSPRAIERTARLLRARRRGLIVCGPDDDVPDFAEAVAALSATTGYPILADPLSQLRYGPHDRSLVLGAYDLFLRAPGFAVSAEPEAIIHFGATPTSKAFERYAASNASAVHVAVDPAGAWRDPGRLLRRVITAEAAPFARALAEALAKGSEPLPGWAASFQRAEAAARDAVKRRLEAEGDEITEPGLFPALLEAIPDRSLLFVGNSMPVRDLDSFLPGSMTRVRVLGNRGANGIDGVLSTALGASSAFDGPVVAVLGDLSFHQDLNGLAALREGRAKATIIVVNNDGGGIFSFLPIAEHEEVFERYFGTPHGLDFEPACALYGVPYSRATSRGTLIERAAASLRARRSEVIEVRTERGRNVALHRAILADAVRAVETT